MIPLGIPTGAHKLKQNMKTGSQKGDQTSAEDGAHGGPRGRHGGMGNCTSGALVKPHILNGIAKRDDAISASKRRCGPLGKRI